MAGGKIFICYRRDDTAGDAGRLFDRLKQRFPGRVFIDVAGISIGTRWEATIEETLRGCTVAVVLIGSRWLAAGPDGTPRIASPDDPTRREISTALKLGLTLVPVAVAGGTVPDKKRLPPDVAPLVDWQAYRIDHDDFDHDAARLVRALERVLGETAADPEDHQQHAVSDAGTQLGTSRTARRVASFGFAIGSFKLWVTLGMAAMLVIAVGTALQLDGGLGDEPEPSDYFPPSQTDERPPPDPADTTTPAPAPIRPEPNAPAPSPPMSAPNVNVLDGTYVLETYSFNGVMLPVSGAMRLTMNQPGLYMFDTRVFDQSTGSTFFYTGTIQGAGANWMTQTVNTNDPSAVFTPIPTEMILDGPTLRTRNAFGQVAVWRRQQ